MVDINDFITETTCEYKGERYSVRDNGAVMRHAKDGKKARPLDNVWTFGKKDAKNGYMTISSHRVHIIVARAFVSGYEEEKIVDHIDTNRCNNRPENLRWLTRLENVLLNEATLKKVIYLCGGDINNFLNNPSCLRDLSGDNQDVSWMRTVTAEEAKLAWEKVSAWAKRPTSTLKMMMRKNETKRVIDESLTNGALQCNFHEKMRFPKCPKANCVGGLETYAKKLERGMVVALSDSENEYEIDDLGWSYDWNCIVVKIKTNRWQIPFSIHISYENGKFVHTKGEYDANYRFCDSPSVLQLGAYTLFSFPACPKEGNITLEEYANILKKGVLCEKSGYGECYVYDREITKSQSGSPILYVGILLANSIKSYADMIVFIENGKVIHQLGETYFSKETLDRNFSNIRGQEWDKNEIFLDDLC